MTPYLRALLTMNPYLRLLLGLCFALLLGIALGGCCGGTSDRYPWCGTRASSR